MRPQHSHPRAPGVRRSVRALLAIAALAALAAPASASTVLRFDLDDLVDRAAVIVHGKVLDKQSRRGSDGSIVTDLRVEVEDALKGVEGGTFKFTVFGGVLGTRGSAVAGAATFERGEEILVFLDRPNKRGVRGTIGLSQGKYTIREVDGERLAFRDLEGLRLMDRRSGEIEDAKTEQGMPFDELLERVQARLAETQPDAESGR